MQAILTDIEGTISDPAFGRDVLLPYAARTLPDFVREHAGEADVADALEDARGVMGAPDADLELVITQLLEWIARDAGVTPLKTLQGLVWQQGYRAGELTGHVYADAAEALRLWHQADISLYTYSSASITGQHQLLAHSTQGDLTALFSGHFDTTTGSKREPISYRLIRAHTEAAAEQTLFLSDATLELDAASEVGFATCLMVRDGEAPIRGRHEWATDFTGIPQLR